MTWSTKPYIEMTSEQMGLERKKAIDNARLFVGIIIGYSFFHTFCLFLLSSLPLHVASNILNECMQNNQRSNYIYSILDFLLKFKPVTDRIPSTFFFDYT